MEHQLARAEVEGFHPLLDEPQSPSPSAFPTDRGFSDDEEDGDDEQEEEDLEEEGGGARATVKRVPVAGQGEGTTKRRPSRRRKSRTTEGSVFSEEAINM